MSSSEREDDTGGVHIAVPDFQDIMLPLLRLAGEGEQSLNGAMEKLAEEFQLSQDDLNELMPSGALKFRSRVSWAKTYLKKAGLLESRKRGFFNITERGLEVLKEDPSVIDVDFLMQFPEFAEFREGSGKPRKTRKRRRKRTGSRRERLTPEERLERAYDELRKGLAAEILDIVRNSSPEFFERLVVDLLVRMGYGGSREDAGSAIGRQGDGGVDGIIKEDRLGLDVIYIQAKRWNSSVSRPEIQKFVGALQGKRAGKGIFITTSNFTEGAREYVSKIDSRIVLIDGMQMANFMIEHGVGVTEVASYSVKKIDNDYFSE